MKKLPDRDTILDYQDRGLTVSEIAAIYDVHTNTVYAALRKVTPDLRVAYLPPQHVIDTWREQGYSPDEIQELCHNFTSADS